MNSREIARRHFVEQARAMALDINQKETNYYLEFVVVERDPDRVWAAGDPELTYDEFLEQNDLCEAKVYRAFAAGLAVMGGSPELALYIGHEAVVYAGEMASPDQVAQLIQLAKNHREQHGVVPDRAALRRAMGYA